MMKCESEERQRGNRNTEFVANKRGGDRVLKHGIPNWNCSPFHQPPSPWSQLSRCKQIVSTQQHFGSASCFQRVLPSHRRIHKNVLITALPQVHLLFFLEAISGCREWFGPASASAVMTRTGSRRESMLLCGSGMNRRQQGCPK